MLGLIACERSPERAAAALIMHSHPNGLRIAAGPEWRAAYTEQGLRFEPADGNAGRRQALEVTAQLADAPPAPALTRQQSINGRSLSFRVDVSEDAGSAGNEYVLVAAEPYAGRTLIWRQAKQSERGEPAFELWELAAGLAPAPTDR